MRSVLLAVLIIGAGCGSEIASRPPGQNSTSSTAVPRSAFDWHDPTMVADLGDGWTIAACEGDAPMLCISRNDAVVGTVEAARYGTTTFDFLDRGADDLTNLRAIAADFTEAFRADRLAGCGPTYGYEPLPPQAFRLGDTTALAYGFVGTNPDNTPSETTLQYAAISGDDIVIVSANAYDEGGCPGRDDLSGFDSPTLAGLRPHIEAALARVGLPSTR